MSAGRESAPPARWTFLGLGFRAWAGLVALAHLVGGAILFEPILHPGGDNAIYMILGEALRSGEGYRDLYLPGTPIHTKYPPFYPLFLGVLGWAGGAQLLKVGSLALTTAAVWGAALLGRRLVGESAALMAAGVLALNPVLLEYSHWALSEAPFVCLVVLALLWMEREESSSAVAADRRAAPLEPAEGSREGVRAIAVGIALALAAFLTRTAGLALLAALPVALWWRGRRRRALAAAGAGTLALGGWALFQRLAAPDRPGYLQELLMANPYDPAAGSVGAAGLLVRAARNVWAYLSEVLPGSLLGSPAAPEGTGGVLLGVLVAALALVGWAARARRPGPAELFAVAYAALIAVWPEVWTDRRFLLPLLPLVLIYACAGAQELAARVAGGWGRPKSGDGVDSEARGRMARRLASGALALLLAVPAVRAGADLAPERIRCLAAYRAGEPCDLPAYASLYAAARWAAAATPADAIVVNRKPSLFYWVGRRRGDVYPFSTEPDVVLNGLETMGADYVVVDQVSATTFRYLIPAVQAHPNRFELAYQGGEPATLVLRFLPPPRTARGPGGAGERGSRGDEARGQGRGARAP